MSPQELVERYIRTDQRRDAKVAAMILRACPEFIGDEKIDSFLGRIGAGTIRQETVLAWTETARVNGSRPASRLTVWQRNALAAELEKFAEGLR